MMALTSISLASILVARETRGAALADAPPAAAEAAPAQRRIDQPR
jgi:hypothetical protein